MAIRKLSKQEAGKYGAAVAAYLRGDRSAKTLKAMEAEGGRRVGIRPGFSPDGLRSHPPKQEAYMSSDMMDRRFDSLGRRAC